jgi:hypothetical protein
MVACQALNFIVSSEFRDTMKHSRLSLKILKPPPAGSLTVMLASAKSAPRTDAHWAEVRTQMLYSPYSNFGEPQTSAM